MKRFVFGMLEDVPCFIGFMPAKLSALLNNVAKFAIFPVARMKPDPLLTVHSIGQKALFFSLSFEENELFLLL